MTPAPYLVALGGLAILFVGWRFVREQSNEAALRFYAAGALAVAIPVTHWVLPYEISAVATTPLIVASAASASWGLVLLVDALNPRQSVQLAPALMAIKHGGFGGMGIAPRIVWGIIALVAIGVLYGDSLTKLGCVAGVAVIIFGTAVLNARDHRGGWVLERHPEWVVWVYASTVTMVSRRYGTRTPYYFCVLGLKSGLRVPLPAASPEAAAMLALDVAKVVPAGVAMGYTPELDASYRLDPVSIKQVAR